MVRIPESRKSRRIAKRRADELKQQEKLAEKMARQLEHPLKDPRAGDDRRQAERRQRSMTPAELDRWLREHGMSGADRRKAERRQGDRRR